MRVACVGLAIMAVVSGAWWSPSVAVHVALRASHPRPNDTLSIPPRSIQLDFTQAVELRLARLSLLAADSATVPLGPVRAADTTSRAIIADVIPPLAAGTYRVRWAVTSRDSHTIRGEFVFTVRRAAIDTVPTARAVADSVAALPDSVGSAAAAPDADTEFDARAPAYIAIRWLGYAGMLGIIGALCFQVGVLPAVARRAQGGDPAGTAVAFERALAAARRGAIVGAAVLLAANGLRLVAQVRTVVGDADTEPAMMSALLGGTVWGWAWLAQVIAAIAALGLAIRLPTAETAPRRSSVVGAVGGLVVLILAVSAAVSGHPAGASPAGLAIGMDAAHVLATGGWIGTLGFVAFAGIPATGVIASASRPRLVHDLVTAFSRIALACVGLIVLTGVAGAWIQMRSVTALWTTSYGQVLLLKLALVAAVGAAGAYNWRIATPRILQAGGIARIRTVMLAELTFAIVVLAVTSALVATPPPTDAMDGTVAETAAR